MKKYLSRRKKKKLLAALLTGLCLVTPWNRAEAVSSYTTSNGLIRLDYYGAGESFTAKRYNVNSSEEGKVFGTSQGTLPDWQKERVNFAADYWDGLLKHTSTAKQPVILPVMVDKNYNNAGTAVLPIEAEAGGQTIMYPAGLSSPVSTFP